MKSGFSRRDFLKFSGLSLAGFGLYPYSIPRDGNEIPDGIIGRVTVDQVAPIYLHPRFNSGIVRYTRRDELLNIYFEINPPDGPLYNPLWYRVWGGYVHSAYIQPTKLRYNPALSTISEGGQLSEVTVPYSSAYTFNQYDGWQIRYRLYYSTTHWITSIEEGPDGKAWYRITSEIDQYLTYFVPTSHLRPINDDEISPISPDLEYGDKRIHVPLSAQMLTAYEYDQPVYSAIISSGLGSVPVPQGKRTPSGQFHITSKTPSKHMGQVSASGAPDGYILPGVPWTSFFIFETGVAFHGTFWHNNFGSPMSHGCINMKNEDAKWLFRWVTPVFDTPVEDQSGWDKRGFGTQVIIE